MKPLLTPLQVSVDPEKKEPTWKSLIAKNLGDIKLEVDMTISKIFNCIETFERNRSKFLNFEASMALMASHVFVGIPGSKKLP